MHSSGQSLSNFTSQLTMYSAGQRASNFARIQLAGCLHSLNEYYLKRMHSICDTVLITSDEIPRDLLLDRNISRFRVSIRFGLTPALYLSIQLNV